MNLEELIQRLQEIAEDHGAEGWDVEVAQQPNYPLLSQVEAISFDSINGKLYIAIGSATEYGVRAMWNDGEDLREEEDEDEDYE